MCECAGANGCPKIWPSLVPLRHTICRPQRTTKTMAVDSLVKDVVPEDTTRKIKKAKKQRRDTEEAGGLYVMAYASVSNH